MCMMSSVTSQYVLGLVVHRFGLNLHLPTYFMYTRSENSQCHLADTHVRLNDGCICRKFQNFMCWLIIPCAAL